MIRSITIPFDDRYRFCSVLDGGVRNGVQVYFVDYPPFFDRDALYGTPLGDYHDNAERFALFCRAVLEATKVLGKPDLFHCHDWQTALIPILLKTLYREDPAFAQTPCVFTIHNLGYQGLFPPEVLPLLMLPWDLFTMAKLEFYGKVNFLKGAIDASRLTHHGEQKIRSGDPDRRIRLRVGGCAAGASQHACRDPQRRRLFGMESRDRPNDCRQLFGR